MTARTGPIGWCGHPSVVRARECWTRRQPGLPIAGDSSAANSIQCLRRLPTRDADEHAASGWCGRSSVVWGCGHWTPAEPGGPLKVEARSAPPRVLHGVVRSPPWTSGAIAVSSDQPFPSGSDVLLGASGAGVQCPAPPTSRYRRRSVSMRPLCEQPPDWIRTPSVSARSPQRLSSAPRRPGPVRCASGGPVGANWRPPVPMTAVPGAVRSVQVRGRASTGRRRSRRA